MITWMQTHKKYLIITIWISTIAFVGAGFVGWGQYDYSHKAGAVAEVGEVEITRGDLEKSYSRLYSQYNEMFQGNFDEEKAKTFGLQRQALKQLTDQALLLNLAITYDLEITNKEILVKLTSQEYFFENGVFNKEIYKSVLSRNNLTMSEYESDLKKQLLIAKVLKLLPVQTTENEDKILSTIMSISDKITYLVLTDEIISIDSSDEALKKFWETKKQNYMTDISYKIEYIKNEPTSLSYDEATITRHYNDNKTHFKNNEGKILSLEDAQTKVIAELNEKSTKKIALRTYINYKKGKLDKSVKINTHTVSGIDSLFDNETVKNIAKLTVISPYMKPIKIDNEYFTIKLLKTIPSKIKLFEDAKAELLPLYTMETKKEKLLELAETFLKDFNGTTTDFITRKDSDKIEKLSINNSNEFLEKLFDSQKKRSFIVLNDGKIVLYDILEQNLIASDEKIENSSILDLKNNIFNQSLVNNLNTKYNTKILIEGL